MSETSYLRPTAFVDSPFDLDGKVARLAGGLAWFSAVEAVVMDAGRRVSIELIPVERIEDELPRLGADAEAAWRRLIAPRAPLSLGPRTVRLDQPQVVGILNLTPDSFSDGGRFADAAAGADAGFAMAEAGAAIVDIGGESTRPGAKPVWEGGEIERVLPAGRPPARGGEAGWVGD